MSEKLQVVLFSGGSGTHSITEAFIKQPQLELTILINAYDDGHSTGRLRKFIPGMLGPSDVRKNISRLMPRKETCHQALQRLSDVRLPKGIAYERGMEVAATYAEGRGSSLEGLWGALYRQLTVAQAEGWRDWFAIFMQYAREREQVGKPFDFNDCALGNILFAGCHLAAGRDFNRAMDDFGRYYEISARLLNITLGESLFLVAEKEDGSVLKSEGDIVSAQSTAKISHLYLLDEPTYRSQVELAEEVAWKQVLPTAVNPRMNPAAAAAIAAADVIIYGPGTQHSSLFPSYLTTGVAEAVASNLEADKIFVGNIKKDFDIQDEDAGELARKLLGAMSRYGQVAVRWSDLVTHFFFQGRGDQADYVPFDEKAFHFPLETVKLRDWETSDGKHAGGYVLEELQQIVQSRLSIQLDPARHLVSIIVPAWNEAATVEEVLRELNLLDFSRHDLGKEIVLVDGGSTDGTAEKARTVRGVRVHEARGGRGAALRAGIAQARGDVIVFFPADREYQTEDVNAIVDGVVVQGYKAVYGTRAVKTILDDQLKKTYEGSSILPVLSKYGGMALSTTALFLFNRYITDTLTSLKGFDARSLRALGLESNGVDLDAELVAKLSRQKEFILEIPVDYSPRTRAQGKKMTMGDGFGAILALWRYRFFRR